MALNWEYELIIRSRRKPKRLRMCACRSTSAPAPQAGRRSPVEPTMCLANLKSAAASGLANRAIGYLNTDWGDLGHLQYLPVSYLSFAAGAAYSWCFASNESLDIAAALDVHVFLRRPRRRAGPIDGRPRQILSSRNKPAATRRVFLVAHRRGRPAESWEVVTKEEFDEAERVARRNSVASTAPR